MIYCTKDKEEEGLRGTFLCAAGSLFPHILGGLTGKCESELNMLLDGGGSRQRLWHVLCGGMKAFFEMSSHYRQVSRLQHPFFLLLVSADKIGGREIIVLIGTKH